MTRIPTSGEAGSAPNELTPMLTVDEAAKYLKVHRETILRMIRRGDLAAFKVGTTYRISPDEFAPTRRPKPVAEKPEVLRLSRFARPEWRRQPSSATPSGTR